MLVTPVFTHLYPRAYEHFQRLTIVAATYCPFDFEVFVPERQLIHGAMNQAVDIVLQQGFAGMITFDDDCLPALWRFADARRFQVIPRLLGLWEEGRGEVIAGVGYMRNYPHTTTVGRLYAEGMTALRDQQAFKGFYWMDDLEPHVDELDDQGLLRVDFCGMPVMFISRRVFVDVTQAEPWKTKDGQIVPLRHTARRPAFGVKDDADGGACTHDVFFCNQVRRAGIPIYADTNIDCGHIIDAPIVNRWTRGLARAAFQPKETSDAGTTASESLGPARERLEDLTQCAVPV